MAVKYIRTISSNPTVDNIKNFSHKKNINYTTNL